jgi:hypothetical protein
VTKIRTIEKHGKIKSSFQQFTSVEEIIAIHLWHYNAQVNSLMKTKDIDESKVDGEIVTWKHFYAAREKKIRAYVDCLNTLGQKEELVQLINSNLTVEINTKNSIIIKDAEPKFNVTKLTFEEQLELYEGLKEARKVGDNLISVIQANTANKNEAVEVDNLIVETPNIQQIKQVQLPSVELKIPVTNFDPTIRLRQSLERLAAEKFKEVGGTLTEEEEKLINSE